MTYISNILKDGIFKSMRELFHFIVRTPKKDSSFLYFQLEACEGLCFYSTLDFIPGQAFRDIDIKGSIEFRKETLSLLNGLKTSIKIEILLSKVINDN